MPADIKSVLADPKFQSLSQPDQISVLSHVDPNFAGLSASDQHQVLAHISNVVSIGGQQVDLKTGAGASSAAATQSGINLRRFIHPVSKSAGILQTGPTEVPDSDDPNATVMPSAESGIGVPGNLTGKVQTQSINQANAQAKQGIIGAGMALVPEAIPELAGGGAGTTLANVGIRGANAGLSSGAATVVGQAATGENPLDTASLKETGTNAALGAAIGAGSKVIEAIPGAAKGAVNAAKENFGSPTAPEALAETPAPVSSPLEVDTSLSDATLRKLGAKNLTPGGRETLRTAAGPVIQAGSSPELHLIRAIPEINSNIAADGAKLDSILKNAGPLPEAPAVKVNAALDNLRENLPGGQEEVLGKAIDKEQTRYADALKSTDPQTLNQTIRDLDERISDYSAPENQLEGPASVRDAALVTIRRELRTALNDAIPASKNVNASLANSLDARAFLRQKYGTLANDSAGAMQQYQQQLQLGQDQLSRDIANENLQQRYNDLKERNATRRKVAGAAAAAVGGAGVFGAVKKLVP